MKKSVFNTPGIVKKEQKIDTPVFKKGGEVISSEDEPKVLNPRKSTRDNAKGAFIGKLFQIRDITHLLHLKTESYAAHKALGDFYEEILSFTDAIAEIYQSVELLDIRIPATVLDTTAIDYISTFKQDVKAYKTECDWDEVVNILDDVLVLCSATLYKLKHLK